MKSYLFMCYQHKHFNYKDVSVSSLQLFSRVQLFATPWTVALQAPQSIGIPQAKILEWVAVPSSMGSSQPRDRTRSLALQEDSLPSEPPGKSKNTGVGSLSLHQGIFPPRN